MDHTLMGALVAVGGMLLVCLHAEGKYRRAAKAARHRNHIAERRAIFASRGAR